MKKYILGLIIMGILLVGSVFAYGVYSFNVITETEFKSIDMVSYNIDCKLGYLNIVEDNGEFVLRGTLKCNDFMKDEATYRRGYSVYYIEYSGNDFFSCLRNGEKDTVCFETYAQHYFDETILNYQYLHRKKLKDMQLRIGLDTSSELSKYYKVPKP